MTTLSVGTSSATWLDGIDVSEHHQIDFEEVRRQGTTVVIARAGRGTRQDSRWVEHVRAAELAGLALGSYWYLYPSHTTAHHQAELWMAAIAVAPSLFPAGHWLHVATTDGLDAR
ncbi:MAG: GH25 family lysozyme, partial [Ilumatobacteraceae bacterium]